jgi:hypothetical protein
VVFLGGLDRSAAGDLLDRLRPGRSTAAVRSSLWAATGGNPRALTDLAGVLTDDQLAGVVALPDPPPSAPGCGTPSPPGSCRCRRRNGGAARNTLGEVGSRIVNETIVGQISKDPESFLAYGWSPAEGVRLPDGSAVDSIPRFLRFAGVR